MKILLVDDDPASLGFLAESLRQQHCVTACLDSRLALDRLAPLAFDMVLTDLRMPPPDGLEILRAAQALDPPVPVIVLTAVNEARPAVDALRLGARDFLVKPVRAEQIAAAVARAELDLAPGRLDSCADFGLVGDSAPIQLVRRILPALAASRESVLILGETGTGKELVARALHSAGPRADRPFVAHNMAATPSELAESLFMGHARGSFSGAVSEHAGLFEQANGGTLFLDEIDSFPPALQPKLLRVLEGGRVQRVGSSAVREVEVRVIAACAGDLCAQVQSGTFRADLYYRLHQLEVVLPPLRERAGDLPLLIGHFLEEVTHETGRAARVDGCAMERLLGYSWPGNVRELRNVLRAAAVLAGGDPIRSEHFPRGIREGAGRNPVLDGSLRLLELRHIREVLESVDGNQSQAARVLGIDRGTLARKLSTAKREEAGRIERPGA